MAAPKGHKFWKLRKTHGKPRKFPEPEDLWRECCEYFEWVEANPLYEYKAFPYQGEVTVESVPKMRAMTIGGLCLYLEISQQNWREYKGRENYSAVTSRVEEIIKEQKFTGAAAELLNPNIIARDLGLRDKIDNTHTGKDGGPIQTQDVSSMSDEELHAIISGGKPDQE